MEQNFNRRTLVIDSSFRPIKIINWKRAIYYIVSNRGFSIDEYEDFTINSIKFSINVPKILQVRGKNPIDFSNREVSLTNSNIFIRDNHTCAYCVKRFQHKELSVDHIIPKCQGGENTWENLVTSCNKCNNKKGGRTPQEAKMPLKIQPTKLNWSARQHLGLKKEELDFWEKWIF